MIYNKEISYEETKEIINNFFNQDTELRTKITTEVPNFRVLIDIMLRNFDYAVEHNEEGLIEEDTLLEGDISRLTYLNYILPSFYLADKYPNLSEFFSAYVLISKNYLDLYGQQIISDYIDSVTSLINLLQIESNFQRLIVVSETLIEKYKFINTNIPETLHLSNLYLKAMLGKEE